MENSFRNNNMGERAPCRPPASHKTSSKGNLIRNHEAADSGTPGDCRSSKKSCQFCRACLQTLLSTGDHGALLPPAKNNDQGRDCRDKGQKEGPGLDVEELQASPPRLQIQVESKTSQHTSLRSKFENATHPATHGLMLPWRSQAHPVATGCSHRACSS